MKKLLISTVILTALSGSVMALSGNPSPVESETKSQLELQVDNHEQRIGDLEVKTDATQTQVNQNSQDIKVIQNNTQTDPAPSVDPVVTPVAQPEPVPVQDPVVEPTPTPEPTPQPEPTPEPEPINPLTIVSMTDTPRIRDHACVYTLYDGRRVVAYTGNTTPCQQVGEILTGINGY